MASAKRRSSKSSSKSVALDPPLSKFLTGSENGDFSLTLLNQMLSTIWVGGECTEDRKDRLVQFGLGAMGEIAPRDGIEGMLAAQMVAVHSAAQECFRRAAIPEQTFLGREMALRYGTRLARLYAEQIAALEKYRGKGQQTVVVKRVDVGQGGQAIVGNVSRGEGQTSNRGEQPHAKAVTHAPEPTLRSPNETRDAMPITGDAER